MLALPPGTGSYGTYYPIGQEVRAEYLYDVISAGDPEFLAHTLYDVGQQGEEAAAQFGYVDVVASLLSSGTNKQVLAAACAAIRGAGVYGHPYVRDVGALLTDYDAEVKYQACMTLASMGSAAQNATIGLLPLLKDSHEGVRCAALSALGSIGAESAIGPISSKLQDQCPEVKGAACMALGQLGKAAANKVDDIVKLIDEPRTRLAAITALGDMREVSASNLEKVCACIQDEDEDVRIAACMVVGKKATKANLSNVLKTLTSLLSHQDGRFRAIAAVAIGYMGPLADSTASQIENLLSDDFKASGVNALTMGGVRNRSPPEMRKVSCAAAFALGQLGPKGKLRHVEVGKLLSDEDWEVRLTACEALGKMGQAASSQAGGLAGVLKDNNYLIRSTAVKALGRLGDASYVDAIAELVDDKAPTVQSEALMALGQMGGGSVPHLQKIAGQADSHHADVRVAAIKALADLGSWGQYYAGFVALKLEDEAYLVKVAAIEALGNMGERGASYKEEIAELQDNPIEAVRKAAGDCYGKMTGKHPAALLSPKYDGEGEGGDNIAAGEGIE